MISRPLDHLAVFFRWWGDELLSCVPKRLRRRLRMLHKSVFVSIDDNQLILDYGTDTEFRPFGRISLTDQELARRFIAGKLKGVRWMFVGVVALLPERKVLRRNVELPIAAAENLHEVIGFELDRYVPFQATEVYVDFRINSRNQAAKRMSVLLAASPRDTVDGLLAEMSNFGISPDRVSVKVAHNTADLRLWPPRVSTRSPAWRFATASLVVLNVVLVAGALYLPLKHKQELLSRFETEIGSIRTKAATLERQRNIAFEIDAGRRFVTTQRHATPLKVAILDEVASLLADNTWLVQIHLTGNRLILSGFAPTASDLIPLLEASNTFSDVRFAAPVMPDPRFEIERFNLTTKLTSNSEGG